MLTTSQDTFVGGTGNDTFNAGVGIAADGVTLVNTLQGIDSINGGAGTDTLNVTLNGGSVTPSLTSVENVNLRSTSASVLDLGGSTAVTNVTVANSTATAGVLNVGAAALKVANQNAEADFSGSTATALNLTLDTVGKAIASGAHITVDLAKAAAAKATSLNVTANNANADLKETTVSAAVTSLSVAATGTNELNVSAADAGTIKTLAVTGAGSVDFTTTGTNSFAALTSVTAGDGGVKLVSTNATAGALTVATGAGVDNITANGASIKTLDVGAGNDNVTLQTGALSATSIVNLGAGNDSVTLTVAPTAGATINGGDGTDTFGVTGAIYTTITGAGFTDAQRALISNFEVLKVTDALAAASTTDVSKLAGIGSFVAGNGVIAAGTASVTGLAANASVSIEGAQVAAVTGAPEKFTIDVTGTTAVGADTYAFDGTTITVADADTAGAIAGKLAGGTYTNWTAAAVGNVVTFTAKANAPVTDVTGATFVFTDVGGATTHVETFTTIQQGVATVTAVGGGTLNVALKTDTSADVLNLKLNVGYTENNDATSTITAQTHTVGASNIETLNVESTGTASTKFLAAAGTKADGLNNTLTLTDDALVTLNVKGDQAFSFTSAGTQTKLATIDASALTAGATINGSAALATSAALTIKGSATAANTLTGGAAADTISGGSGNDVITGGAKGDTLTGNGGNDKFVFAAGDSVIGTGSFDNLTDFVANTLGNGANGAADKTGAITAGLTDATKLNGDVLSIAKFGDGSGGVKVDVLTTAADALTYLQNQKAANTVVAALDSTGQNLYIDNTGDGVADLYIHLTGVSTINAAAFVLA